MKVKLVKEEGCPVYTLARPDEAWADIEIDATQEDVERWQRIMDDFDQVQEEIRVALKQG